MRVSQGHGRNIAVCQLTPVPLWISQVQVDAYSPAGLIYLDMGSLVWALEKIADSVQIQYVRAIKVLHIYLMLALHLVDQVLIACRR